MIQNQIPVKINLFLMGSSGLEPPTSRLSGARSNQLSYEPAGFNAVALQLLWRWWDSNPWPPACRAGALPTELHPHWFIGSLFSFNELSLTENWTTTSVPYSYCRTSCLSDTVLLRKEVIQPHLPIRLPCYDLTPIIEPTFDCFLLAVRTQASGVPNFHGLTGGVYKARERIHRGMLIRDY